MAWLLIGSERHDHEKSLCWGALTSGRRKSKPIRCRLLSPELSVRTALGRYLALEGENGGVGGRGLDRRNSLQTETWINTDGVGCLPHGPENPRVG